MNFETLAAQAIREEVGKPNWGQLKPLESAGGWATPAEWAGEFERIVLNFERKIGLNIEDKAQDGTNLGSQTLMRLVEYLVQKAQIAASKRAVREMRSNLKLILTAPSDVAPPPVAKMVVPTFQES